MSMSAHNLVFAWGPGLTLVRLPSSEANANGEANAEANADDDMPIFINDHHTTSSSSTPSSTGSITTNDQPPFLTVKDVPIPARILLQHQLQQKQQQATRVSSGVTPRKATVTTTNQTGRNSGTYFELAVAHDRTFCSRHGGNATHAGEAISALVLRIYPFFFDVVDLQLVAVFSHCGSLSRDPFAKRAALQSLNPLCRRTPGGNITSHGDEENHNGGEEEDECSSARRILETTSRFFVAESSRIAYDAAYLFTGYDDGSSIAGAAYLRGACVPRYRFGWVEITSSVYTPQVVTVLTHELGHTLGAQHADAGFMQPRIPRELVAGDNWFFAQKSIFQMREFIRRISSAQCLVAHVGYAPNTGVVTTHFTVNQGQVWLATDMAFGSALTWQEVSSTRRRLFTDVNATRLELDAPDSSDADVTATATAGSTKNGGTRTGTGTGTAANVFLRPEDISPNVNHVFFLLVHRDGTAHDPTAWQTTPTSPSTPDKLSVDGVRFMIKHALTLPMSAERRPFVIDLKSKLHWVPLHRVGGRALRAVGGGLAVASGLTHPGSSDLVLFYVEGVTDTPFARANPTLFRPGAGWLAIGHAVNASGHVANWTHACLPKRLDFSAATSVGLAVTALRDRRKVDAVVVYTRPAGNSEKDGDGKKTLRIAYNVLFDLNRNGSVASVSDSHYVPGSLPPAVGDVSASVADIDADGVMDLILMHTEATTVSSSSTSSKNANWTTVFSVGRSLSRNGLVPRFAWRRFRPDLRAQPARDISLPVTGGLAVARLRAWEADGPVMGVFSSRPRRQYAYNEVELATGLLDPADPKKDDRRRIVQPLATTKCDTCFTSPQTRELCKERLDTCLARGAQYEVEIIGRQAFAQPEEKKEGESVREEEEEEMMGEEIASREPAVNDDEADPSPVVEDGAEEDTAPDTTQPQIVQADPTLSFDADDAGANDNDITTLPSPTPSPSSSPSSSSPPDPSSSPTSSSSSTSTSTSSSSPQASQSYLSSPIPASTPSSSPAIAKPTIAALLSAPDVPSLECEGFLHVYLKGGRGCAHDVASEEEVGSGAAHALFSDYASLMVAQYGARQAEAQFQPTLAAFNLSYAVYGGGGVSTPFRLPITVSVYFRNWKHARKRIIRAAVKRLRKKQDFSTTFLGDKDNIDIQYRVKRRMGNRTVFFVIVQLKFQPAFVRGVYGSRINPVYEQLERDQLTTKKKKSK